MPREAHVPVATQADDHKLGFLGQQLIDELGKLFIKHSAG